ncbi:MAG: hypothetical protein WA988_04425 [Candidatus Nanopelagicales bacterium]
MIAGAFDVGGAHPVGLGGALFEFGGHGEGGLDGQRRAVFQQQLRDALVEIGPPGMRAQIRWALAIGRRFQEGADPDRSPGGRGHPATPQDGRHWRRR